MKPHAFSLQVAKYFLVGVGLCGSGMFLLEASGTGLLASVPGAVLLTLSYYPLKKAYLMVKNRRLQRYTEEIDQRMKP